MMGPRILVLAAAAGLAGCGQSGGDAGAASSSVNATATAKAPKRPSYCFFKDAATRGWTASANASGELAVKGQVKVEDRRYRGDLSQSEVTGDTTSVWLSMAPNTTGMGAQDNWWDVSLAVPDSGAVKSVTVLCGKKTIAELTVKR